MKIDHPEPLQSSLFTAPPIPRITVKLEPPVQSAASTSKATIKKETSAGYVFPCQKIKDFLCVYMRQCLSS